MVDEVSLSFDEVTSTGKTSVIEFWAPWCSACKAMFPALERLDGEHGETITVAKFDVSQAPERAVELGIRSVPAFLIIKDGEVVETITGSRTYDKLVEDLGAYL